MTRNGIHMRRLAAADAEKLGEFFERNNRPEQTRFFRPFPLTRAQAACLLRPESKDLFFALEENGEFAGFSMLRGFDEGYSIPSFGILIDERRQGKGLGRLLTEWTIQWGDQAGFEKIRLTVSAQNQKALGLYQQLGFRETGRDAQANGEERLIMHRQRAG